MSHTTIAKVCRCCGKPFEAKRADQMYCTPACKYKAYYAKKYGRKRGKIPSGFRVWFKDAPKSYAEIQAHNAKNPLKTGWRGSPCMGGWC